MSTAEINIAKLYRPERPSILWAACRAALSNCARCWFFWLWVVVGGMFGAATVSSHRPEARWVWPILALYAGAFLPLMQVEHIASNRAVLVPRFRQVHIVAQVLCSVGVFGLLTAWLAWWSQISLWPVTGVALFALALGHWVLRGGALGIATNLSIPILIGGALIIPLVFYPVSAATVRLFFLALQYAETPTANVEFGLLGVLLLGWLFRWLWKLDEDHSAYERCRRIAAATHFTVRAPRRQSWAQPGIVDGVSAQRPSPWLIPVVFLQDWLLDASLRRARRPGGWSILRWEIAWPGFLLTVVGFWLAVLAVALGLWGSHRVNSAHFELYISGLLLQLMIFVRIEQRSILAVESLRPVSRQRLLRQLGSGVLFPLAGALLVAAIVSMAAFLSNPVLRYAHPSPTFTLAFCSFGLIWLGAQTALLILLRTFGSVVLDVIGFLAGSALFILFFNVVGYFRLSTSPWPLFLAAAVTGAIGVLLLWLAYRRWLVTDLD